MIMSAYTAFVAFYSQVPLDTLTRANKGGGAEADQGGLLYPQGAEVGSIHINTFYVM
jgi:hypothetical protein